VLIVFAAGQETDYAFPKSIMKFKFKTDTDLYELMKHGTYALSIAVSRDGQLFVCNSPDRRIRVFHFLTGTKSRVFNESLDVSFVSFPQSVASNRRRLGFSTSLKASDVSRT